jgi:hypothetical protein
MNEKVSCLWSYDIRERWDWNKLIKQNHKEKIKEIENEVVITNCWAYKIEKWMINFEFKNRLTANSMKQTPEKVSMTSPHS